jgi:hypothetical protein
MGSTPGWMRRGSSDFTPRPPSDRSQLLRWDCISNPYSAHRAFQGRSNPTNRLKRDDLRRRQPRRERIRGQSLHYQRHAEERRIERDRQRESPSARGPHRGHGQKFEIGSRQEIETRAFRRAESRSTSGSRRRRSPSNRRAPPRHEASPFCPSLKRGRRRSGPKVP